MKKFRYRFPVTIIVFIIIGLAACAAAIAFNIYLCITEGTAEAVNPALPVVQYTLTFLVSIAAGTILLGILCRSYYGEFPVQEIPAQKHLVRGGIPQ